MTVSISIAGKQVIVGAIGAAAAIFGSTPALSNSSNAIDIAAPLRAAQDARQNAVTSGDEEFRSLFSSWRSLDRQTGYVAPTTAIPVPTFGGVPRRDGGDIFAPTTPGRVSIPSRMPVENVRFTSGFGMRYHPVLGGRRAHKGVDLAAPWGTPVYATADATVGRADWFSGYGLYVQLQHGADIETRYGHMSRLNVYAGQQVRKGDLIGFVGSTGRSTGPHLHYEVRIAGNAVNPIPYLHGAGQIPEVQLSQSSQGGLVPVAAGGPED